MEWKFAILPLVNVRRERPWRVTMECGAMAKKLVMTLSDVWTPHHPCVPAETRVLAFTNAARQMALVLFSTFQSLAMTAMLAMALKHATRQMAHAMLESL
jgi:hypothetical protein